jgi:hypothetical protein
MPRPCSNFAPDSELFFGSAAPFGYIGKLRSALKQSALMHEEDAAWPRRR